MEKNFFSLLPVSTSPSANYGRKALPFYVQLKDLNKV